MHEWNMELFEGWKNNNLETQAGLSQLALKVLHLIDSEGLYGAENMLLALVQEQIKSGMEPLILSAGTPEIAEKALEIEARKRGLPVLKFRMKPGMNLIKACQILRIAKRHGINIMHSHGYKFNILLGLMPSPLFKAIAQIVMSLPRPVWNTGFKRLPSWKRPAGILSRFHTGGKILCGIISMVPDSTDQGLSIAGCLRRSGFRVVEYLDTVKPQVSHCSTPKTPETMG